MWLKVSVVFEGVEFEDDEQKKGKRNLDLPSSLKSQVRVQVAEKNMQGTFVLTITSARSFASLAIQSRICFETFQTGVRPTQQCRDLSKQQRGFTKDTDPKKKKSGEVAKPQQASADYVNISYPNLLPCYFLYLLPLVFVCLLLALCCGWLFWLVLISIRC